MIGYLNSFAFAFRYQPEMDSSAKDMEMLEVNGSEEEKVIMNVSVSNNQTTLKEKFTWGSLFCPSEEIPTHVSGRIVYISTTIVCKCCG